MESSLYHDDSRKSSVDEGPFLEGSLAEETEYMQYHDYRFQWIMNSLPTTTDELRIIDIGPTPNTLKIKERYPHYNVFALDRSDLFKERFNKMGIEFNTCILGEEPIPYPNDYFDVVIFTEVLEHIFAPPTDILRDIKRVMRKGGKLLLSVPNMARLLNRVKLLFGITPLLHPDIQMQKSSIYGYGHVHEYTASEIANLASECNFILSNPKFLQLEFSSLLNSRNKSPVYLSAEYIYLFICKLVPSFRQTICIEATK